MVAPADEAQPPAAQQLGPEPEPEPEAQPAAQQMEPGLVPLEASPERRPRPRRVVRKGRKVVMAVPLTPRKHAFKDISADMATSKLGTYLAVLEADTALLSSQSPTAGSPPSPTEPAVTLIQPRDLSSTLLSAAETAKVVRSVAVRVHHCDELLEMLRQAAIKDEQRVSELQDTHHKLTQQTNKHRDVLVSCADAMGMGDEVAVLLHTTLPLAKPQAAGGRRVVTRPESAGLRLTIVGDVELEGGGRRWSPSPPPSAAGGRGARSSRERRLPVASAEVSAARPHSASSKLTAWTARHPHTAKFVTRPRKPGLAQSPVRRVAEDASLCSWEAHSTGSVSPRPGNPGGKTLDSLGLTESDLESYRRIQHAGSWRGPRAANAPSGRRREEPAVPSGTIGGKECAPWLMAVQSNTDLAAEAAEAARVRTDALSNISFRNGEAVALSMPRKVTLRCADGGSGFDRWLTDSEDPDSAAAAGRREGVGEQPAAQHRTETLRLGVGAMSDESRMWDNAGERSYSKSNFLAVYERDQVRISDCAHSNLHTNLKSGPGRPAARRAVVALASRVCRLVSRPFLSLKWTH